MTCPPCGPARSRPRTRRSPPPRLMLLLFVIYIYIYIERERECVYLYRICVIYWLIFVWFNYLLYLLLEPPASSGFMRLLCLLLCLFVLGAYVFMCSCIVLVRCLVFPILHGFRSPPASSPTTRRPPPRISPNR